MSPMRCTGCTGKAAIPSTTDAAGCAVRDSNRTEPALLLPEDWDIEENRGFSYLLVEQVDLSAAGADEVLVIFHGLNEGSYARMLPWALSFALRLGGLQSYFDAVDLVARIEAGDHASRGAGARVRFLGYSAGGYLALVLLLAVGNPADRFVHEVSAFLFPGRPNPA